MHCDMLKIQDGGAIVEKLNRKEVGTPLILIRKYPPRNFQYEVK